MDLVVLIIAVALMLLLMLAFLLGRHLSHRRYFREEISAVSRQHLELFQGGHLSEAAVEATKAHFRDLLERGRVEEVEASLRPGVHFVVQVRALAELGTEMAGDILERQLLRAHSEDEIEQSWYWIDVAGGLRALNRAQSLPALLRCGEKACEIPLGHLFAAETVCVLGFAGYLRQSEPGPLRTAALRILHRALEGLRWGSPPQIIVEARIGEMIETIYDHDPDPDDPLVARVFHESLRALRRAPHAERILQSDPPDLEAYQLQVSRLTMMEHELEEYLHQAPGRLRHRLSEASPEEQIDILHAMIDLKCEAGETVLTLLERDDFTQVKLAIELLTWSKSPRVGTWLREKAFTEVPIAKRAQKRRRAIPPYRPSLRADICYRAILYALRGHGSPETEALLVHAARDWDPSYRVVAVSSLGWWEPFRRDEVLMTLQEARRDQNRDVQTAARAALARLGERQALQWYRQTLVSEDSRRAHETIQTIATERLTLLWPDLDRLADAEDIEIAHHAREMLTDLEESLFSE